MVVTDFLQTVPVMCFPLLLDTIAKFGELKYIKDISHSLSIQGQQNVDVNICLTVTYARGCCNHKWPFAIFPLFWD